MKKITKKKLSLESSIIRELDPDKLDRVAGGCGVGQCSISNISQVTSTCPSYYCLTGHCTYTKN